MVWNVPSYMTPMIQIRLGLASQPSVSSSAPGVTYLDMWILDDNTATYPQHPDLSVKIHIVD